MSKKYIFYACVALLWLCFSQIQTANSKCREEEYSNVNASISGPSSHKCSSSKKKRWAVGNSLVFRVSRIIDRRFRGILSYANPTLIHARYSEFLKRQETSPSQWLQHADDNNIAIPEEEHDKISYHHSPLTILSEKNFNRVVVISDMHLRGGVDALLPSDALMSLQKSLRQHDLLLSLGDLFNLEDFTAAQQKAYAIQKDAGRSPSEFLSRISSYFKSLMFLTNRCILVPGNHDVSNYGLGLPRDKDVFFVLRSILSPPQLVADSEKKEKSKGEYMFVLGKCVFLILDTTTHALASGSVDDDGLQAIHKAAEMTLMRNTLVIAMHHSLFDTGLFYRFKNPQAFRNEIEQIPSKYNINVMVLMGHHHKQEILTASNGAVRYISLDDSKSTLEPLILSPQTADLEEII